MAESPSSALPGGVEWLPALGGAQLLRAELGKGDPPALILQSPEGDEHRIEAGPEARFSRTTDYLVPAGLRWSVASLLWADGTRALLPNPLAERGEVIPLPTRRAEPPAAEAASEPLHWTAPPPSGAPDAEPEGPRAPSRTADAGANTPSAVAASTFTAPSAAARHRAPAAADADQPADGSPTHGSINERDLHRDEAADGPRALGPTLERDEAADGWRKHRSALERDLVRAAEAILRARQSERATGDAVLAVLAGAHADLEAVRAARAADAALLAALSSQLEAERSAHAATREAARGDEGILSSLRADLERAGQEAAAARAEVEALRAELDAERAARARAESALGQSLGGPEDLKRHALAQAQVAAAATRRPSDDADRLIAALDAAATSLRATVPTDRADADTRADSPAAENAPPVAALPTPERDDGPVPAADAARLADNDAILPSTRTDAPADAGQRARASADQRVEGSPWRLEAPSRRADLAAPAAVRRPGLLRALVEVAREDTFAASALLAGLLPAQGALLDEELSYDLTVRGYGTFAVTVRDHAAEVKPIRRPRPRRDARFHLAGEPLALAELLAGEQRRIRRFTRGSLRVNRPCKRVQALAALPNAPLSLADAVRAGARLEPALVYRALPFAIAPEWTQGHVFTVAQQIVELAPRTWYVTARDGVLLDVVERAAGHAADATVSMSRAAFDRLLKDEPPVPGDLPVVRGNHTAVAALKRWTELAAGT